MGRIKSAMIKKAALQIYESSDGVSDNFEKNKRLLEGIIYYKSMRNRVAGALVSMKKKESKEKTLKKEPVQEEEIDI